VAFSLLSSEKLVEESIITFWIGRKIGMGILIKDSWKKGKIGTFQPESVALLLRNVWHFSTGTGGNFHRNTHAS